MFVSGHFHVLGIRDERFRFSKSKPNPAFHFKIHIQFPNPKTDRFKIQILFKSEILSLL